MSISRKPHLDPPTARGKLKMHMENQMVLKREKQFLYDQQWNNTVKYYEHWQKLNTKYDGWTSPRYYETNGRLLNEIRQKREKEERLEKRREKLRKLYYEEEQSYAIELMMHKTKQHSQKNEGPAVPVEVLKEVNNEIKLNEQERKRHEAELKLYHQWRINNPIIRQYESKYRHKNLKLSWLDQQIEKRMQKEKEEEELKQLLKEREIRLKEEQEKEEHFKKYMQEKQQLLKECLEQQMKELGKRHELYGELKRQEYEENRHKLALEALEEERLKEEYRRSKIECALYNIRQHRLKLKNRAQEVQDNLIRDMEFIDKLKQLELQEMIDNHIKKCEYQKSMTEYIDTVKEQQQLEQKRQRHLEFLFDSEIKSIYDKQDEMWKQEELKRTGLFKNIMEALKSQVEEKIRKNKEKQVEIEQEQEEIRKRIEEYNSEMERLRQEEEEKARNTRKILDEDVKLKSLKKKQQENLRLKEINEELDRIKIEEERLQDEILKMQRKYGPVKPPRSRLFF